MISRRKIDLLKQKSLSDEEIFNALSGHTRIFLYRDIVEMHDINELFGPYDSVVLLYEKEPNVGHWVGLIRNNDVIDFLIVMECFLNPRKIISTKILLKIVDNEKIN